MRGFSDLNLKISCVFISELDWDGLISEWDMMSKTDGPRPYPIFFSDYTREEMSYILAKTAGSFVEAFVDFNKEDNTIYRQSEAIKFYSRIILEVFYPICKDLNEIQYLIQIYFDQLFNSLAKEPIDDKQFCNKGDQIIATWNRMKPFLKQALTQIYLRQSMHKEVKTTFGEEVCILIKQFKIFQKI